MPANRRRAQPRGLRYGLPYYTRVKADTEYLISNPNAGPVTGRLSVFGKTCKIVKTVPLRLGSNCTTSINLRSIVPGHAGHAVLDVSEPVIVHLLYVWGAKRAVVTGGELAGVDSGERHGEQVANTRLQQQRAISDS